MSIVKIKDKMFKTSIPEAKILECVDAVAEKINRDLDGKNPLFLAVLNGSFIFAADLVRELTIEHEIHFAKVTSYEGTETTGTVKELIGLNVSLKGRDVIVVEDIVDTGITMQHMLKQLENKGASSIEVCTLLTKPGRLQVPLDIKYCAMEIPNDFILGYGLDYNNKGRNYKGIYKVSE